MKNKFVYGQSPNPSNWHEAAKVIKANSPKKGKRDADAKKPSK